MAKRAKPSGEKRIAPVCVSLLVCDQAIVGKDDTVSLIRVVDTLSLSESEVAGLKLGDGVELASKLVVIFKGGGASGEYAIELWSIGPGDIRDHIAMAKPEFQADIPISGRTIIAPLRIKWRGYGSYWLEMQWNGQVIGRTPIGIVAQMAKPATPSQADLAKHSKKVQHA